MKKTYINPQTLVVSVHLQQMIALSGGDKLMTSPAKAQGEVLSRRNNTLWDDEEEE